MFSVPILTAHDLKGRVLRWDLRPSGRSSGTRGRLASVLGPHSPATLHYPSPNRLTVATSAATGIAFVSVPSDEAFRFCLPYS